MREERCTQQGQWAGPWDGGRDKHFSVSRARPYEDYEKKSIRAKSR